MELKQSSLTAAVEGITQWNSRNIIHWEDRFIACFPLVASEDGASSMPESSEGALSEVLARHVVSYTDESERSILFMADAAWMSDFFRLTRDALLELNIKEQDIPSCIQLAPQDHDITHLEMRTCIETKEKAEPDGYESVQTIKSTKDLTLDTSALKSAMLMHLVSVLAGGMDLHSIKAARGSKDPDSDRLLKLNREKIRTWLVDLIAGLEAQLKSINKTTLCSQDGHTITYAELALDISLSACERELSRSELSDIFISMKSLEGSKVFFSRTLGNHSALNYLPEIISHAVALIAVSR